MQRPLDPTTLRLWNRTIIYILNIIGLCSGKLEDTVNIHPTACLPNGIDKNVSNETNYQHPDVGEGSQKYWFKGGLQRYWCQEGPLLQTSTILEAEVGKPPDVPKSHCVANESQYKLNLPAPLLPFHTGFHRNEWRVWLDNLLKQGKHSFHFIIRH